MKCTRCGTLYSPRPVGQEPRLDCNECGARLFNWLGDHFGTRDVASPIPQHNSGQGGSTGGSSQAGLILLAIFIFVAFFSCICIFPFIR